MGSPGSVRHLRKKLVEIAAHHLVDDRLHLGPGELSGCDVPAVAQHRESLCNPSHFFEEMADVDDPQAASLSAGR